MSIRVYFKDVEIKSAFTKNIPGFEIVHFIKISETEAKHEFGGTAKINPDTVVIVDDETKLKISRSEK